MYMYTYTYILRRDVVQHEEEQADVEGLVRVGPCGQACITPGTISIMLVSCYITNMYYKY